MILILAGNHQEFTEYIEEHNLPDSVVRYADSPAQIYGVRPQQVICIGTFWDRPDAVVLSDLAQQRLTTTAQPAVAM